MIELRRGATGAVREEPLTWRPMRMPWSRWWAMVVCGNGHRILIDQYEIAPDGTVSPAVVCLWKGCAWQGYVKLVGWGEGIEGVEAEEARW